ncbi:MAG: FAD-dependent oxidoreductase [Candidatus Hydrogenedentes bacterium]|nr:FAD-dependent oxidoreductase [Candidatus Hydrogenedentota bacterium]
MSTLGTAGLPLRVAIVGSGPSGFYAAEALFKSGLNLSVDMFDRLPVPFGLVRGGVAPDHPKIKSVTRVYDKIAANPGYAFLGNVTIGRDLSVDELSRFYDCVIFASGAETDNRLGIPGEDLPGSHTATEFVGWYNGHPDYRDRVFDLSSEVAAVVGQGNVAMDVSRILAKTIDELRSTDIAEYALDALAESKVKEIHLIGRRGPVQAKFTLAEIKEFGELVACDPVIDPVSLQLDTASQAELDNPDNQHSQKNVAVLRAFAERAAPSKAKRFHIHFLESPVEIRGNGKVESLVLERNRLEGEPFKLRAVGTGEKHEMPCGLVFRSVGYRGVPIPGVPFDERKGRIPNDDGRIIIDGAPWAGHYAVGWIKRGPSGVIGTNKPDSQATAAALLADVPSLSPSPERDTNALLSLLRSRGVRPVSFADWQRIDAAEIERGKAKGKPREKFSRVEDMLALLDA